MVSNPVVTVNCVQLPSGLWSFDPFYTVAHHPDLCVTAIERKHQAFRQQTWPTAVEACQAAVEQGFNTVGIGGYSFALQPIEHSPMVTPQQNRELFDAIRSERR